MFDGEALPVVIGPDLARCRFCGRMTHDLEELLVCLAAASAARKEEADGVSMDVP